MRTRRTTDDYEKETSSVIKHNPAVYRGLRTDRRHFAGRFRKPFRRCGRRLRLRAGAGWCAIPGAELHAERHISADGKSYTDTDLGSYAHDNSHPGTDPGSHAHDNSYTYADCSSHSRSDCGSHSRSYRGSHA